MTGCILHLRELQRRTRELLVMRRSRPVPLNSVMKLKAVRMERSKVTLTVHKQDYLFFLNTEQSEDLGGELWFHARACRRGLRSAAGYRVIIMSAFDPGRRHLVYGKMFRLSHTGCRTHTDNTECWQESSFLTEANFTHFTVRAFVMVKLQNEGLGS